MPISMMPDSGKVNRVSKLIINPDTGPVYCCWDTCDRRARQTWSIRLHEHPLSVPCSDVEQAYGTLGRHTHFTFCCREHADYWAACSGAMAHETAARNRGQIYGMHSAGSKLGRLR